MAITITGNWKLQLISQPIDQPQRFIINNALVGNGTYPDTYTIPINVQGSSWSLNSQQEGSWSGQPGVWISSNNIIKSDITIEGNEEVFYVNVDDYRGGVDYNDMVFRLSRPYTPSTPPTIPPIENIPPPNVPLPLPPVENPPPRPTPPVELSYGKVWTKFDNDDKIPRQRFIETYGIWLDYTGSKTGNFTSYYTCSLDTGSFKKSVYNAPCFDCYAKPHFDLSYGHDGGSGSRDLGGNDFYTPTNAVYGQYRGLCLDPGIKRFRIGNKEIYHFYAINVYRDRMGDRVDEGNIEINLDELNGHAFRTNPNAYTGSNVQISGSNKILRLIDDSTLDLESLTTNSYQTFYQEISESKARLNTSAGPVHFLVSGNLETGIYNSTQPHVYGLFYPKQGIFILDAELLDLSASFQTVTGSDSWGDNSMKIFTAMSGAALRTDLSGDYLGFQARKVRYNYREQYYVRVKNQDYNFTNNWTFVTGSEQLIKDDFRDKPLVYITEIGLYNEQKELLAIAKPSSPIYKNFTEEALFDIQLVW